MYSLEELQAIEARIQEQKSRRDKREVEREHAEKVAKETLRNLKEKFDIVKASQITTKLEEYKAKIQEEHDNIEKLLKIAEAEQ